MAKRYIDDATRTVDHTGNGVIGHSRLVLHVDGGCQPKNPGGVVTCGWVMYSSCGQLLAEEGRIVMDGGADATNNVGEYAALIYALLWLFVKDWKGDLTVKADSKLLVEQVNGRWQVKAPRLIDKHKTVTDLIRKCGFHVVTVADPFPPEGMSPCRIVWIPREQNEVADRLGDEAYQRHVNRPKV